MYCHDSIKADRVCECSICAKNRFMFEVDYYDPVYLMPEPHWVQEKHLRDHLDDGDPVYQSFYVPDVGIGLKIPFAKE